MKTHWITKSIIVGLFFISIFLQMAHAGNEGISGGGKPSSINEASIMQLLSTNDFKKALVNYLQSIPLKQLDISTEDGAKLKAILDHVLINDRLINDINTPNNYKTEGWCSNSKLPTETLENSQLIDHEMHTALACTQVGKPGAEIYFRTAQLGEVYKNLTSEEKMIKLAALVLHEHIHHFQDPKVPFKINESQANIFPAYFINHAKIKDTPLLEWTLSSELAELNQAIGIINYSEKGNKNAFIRITKDKDYQLNFEFCITTEKCNPIVADKKINVFEAWTHSEQLHTEELTEYSTKTAVALSIVTLPLSSVATFGAESAILVMLRALGSNLKWVISEAWYKAIPLTIVFNAGLHPVMSSPLYDYTTTDLLHKLDQKPSTTDGPLIIDVEGEVSLSELTTKIATFVEETRKLQKMSKEALKQWDESD